MRRKGKFDAIIVETTGLADPAPGGAKPFFVDENVGKAGGSSTPWGYGRRRQMAQGTGLRERARGQEPDRLCGRGILINKTDLVSDAEPARGVEGAPSAASIPMPRFHRTERLRHPAVRGARPQTPSISTASWTSKPAFLEREDGQRSPLRPS